MARRSSLASLPSSSRSVETVLHSSQSRADGFGRPMERKVSTLSTLVDSTLDRAAGLEGFNPDELLEKLSVSEVKGVQQKLRHNAEAKQQELRLMRRERYRDLLQASTSITSMAESSQRVLEACHKMHDVVASIQHPRIQKRSSVEEDKHLQALQQLSAHLKLLLDAPEHLWRFMEQRTYLHAAWLYLTARAVHQTLLHGDEDVSRNWQAYGIDVSEDMPLVQRQWDTISPFRSQIAHRATLFLREHTASSTETCAALLTLHLLESRPLVETLSIFLAQRSKTLSSLLPQFQGKTTNGHAHNVPNKDKPSSRARKAFVREARQKLQAVLELVSRTLGTARLLFGGGHSEGVPVIQQALHYIETEEASPELPPGLQMTTQSLLANLPSSAHFLLLPVSIKSYKPYVAGTSTSSQFAPGQLRDKLNNYFDQSVASIRHALEQWVAHLETAREVWDVRTVSSKLVKSLEGLDSRERAQLRSLLDDVSQRQVTSLWKSALADIETSFRERVDHALDALRNNANVQRADVQPVQYLFEQAPLPSASQVGLNLSSAASSFQRYKTTLQRQLHGRTPLIDDILNTVERYARELHEDIDAVRSRDEDSRTLAEQMIQNYRPEAEAFCSRLAQSMEETADLSDDGGKYLRLEGYSLKTDGHVGCSDVALDACRKKLEALQYRTYQRWQDYVLDRIVSAHWPADSYSEGTSNASNGIAAQDRTAIGSPPTRPSSALLQALLALVTSIQDLGVFIDSERRQRIAADSLRDLIIRMLDQIYLPIRVSGRMSAQDVWDLRFIRGITELWGNAWSGIVHRLEWMVSKMQEKQPQLDIDKSLAENLSRVQILLAPMLPPPSLSEPSASLSDRGKSAGLLCYGQPVIEQQFHSALDLVKPSARFGLLLVGNTAVR
ncbi:hypothetical protein IEO21_05074 [Rhodonia placenta]|uniref:Conserved oligomeric Golgi complex subunit 1 n=1 Tax=Rhodonia placenta TaxID=104341 RepID=A0A8H7P2L7_9APHY|nr:hypothetical protein IEO21_05074 [Postia placenta]